MLNLTNMAAIHITDIETAINWWRGQAPTKEGEPLLAPLNALAEVYALMVYYQENLCDEASMPPQALQAWMDWYHTTPDTPCIAICSTSQGDPLCKGCGRTFEEVQQWTQMSAAAKRSTWRRISIESTSWRFNRYAERVKDSASDNFDSTIT